jgi:signal peptidase I
MPRTTARSRRQLIAVSIFLVVVLVFTFTFRMAVVHGDSMLPTFRDGQLLLVNRFHAINGPLRRDDVVLAKMNNDVIIKRIAYLPGDIIRAPEAFRFRRVLEFFEVVREPVPPGEQSGPNERPGMERMSLKVPPGFVVLLGDNRRNSEDSRTFGPVQVSDILGRVVNAPARQ